MWWAVAQQAWHLLGHLALRSCFWDQSPRLYSDPFSVLVRVSVGGHFWIGLERQNQILPSLQGDKVSWVLGSWEHIYYLRITWNLWIFLLERCIYTLKSKLGCTFRLGLWVPLKLKHGPRLNVLLVQDNAWHYEHSVSLSVSNPSISVSSFLLCCLHFGLLLRVSFPIDYFNFLYLCLSVFRFLSSHLFTFYGKKKMY